MSPSNNLPQWLSAYSAGHELAYVYYEEEPGRPGVLGHGNRTFYASFIRYAMGDGRMPEQVERYRLNAEKCLELAQTFNDLEVKRTMLGMADAWLTLAAQHVRNVETVDVLFGPMEAEG